MARQTATAMILVLGAGLALGGCGRKGPLEPPGAPQGTEAPAGTPTPEAKPEKVDHPPGTPVPSAKPEPVKGSAVDEGRREARAGYSDQIHIVLSGATPEAMARLKANLAVVKARLYPETTEPKSPHP